MQAGSTKLMPSIQHVTNLIMKDTYLSIYTFTSLSLVEYIVTNTILMAAKHVSGYVLFSQCDIINNLKPFRIYPIFGSEWVPTHTCC